MTSEDGAKTRAALWFISMTLAAVAFGDWMHNAQAGAFVWFLMIWISVLRR